VIAENITLFEGSASFCSDTEIRIRTGSKSVDIHADNLIIATGARPIRPACEGGELAITSDDFFFLELPPKRILIIGAGYIGMEIAGILNTFKANVTIAEYSDRILPAMDHDISQHIHALYQQHDVNILLEHVITHIKPVDGTLEATVESRRTKETTTQTYDKVLCAIGRVPNVESLNLSNTKATLDNRGYIRTEDDDRTTSPTIYAIGDATLKPALTPVAIKAARRLIDRMYRGSTELMRYDIIPTAVFTHGCEIGAVGLTERRARELFKDDVRVYRTEFPPLRKAFAWNKESRVLTKMIVVGKEERVVGLHIAAPEASEIIQGFAVAVTAGLTKKQFDDTIAIHPTMAEEIVTLR
ncbi:MAG: FAD-dependent oxidoreductase, partial [Polyangiaceae bacterium]|nr:FAD-dependent oxidoreductase [Polyangiaceae bacterium]